MSTSRQFESKGTKFIDFSEVMINKEAEKSETRAKLKTERLKLSPTEFFQSIKEMTQEVEELPKARLVKTVY